MVNVEAADADALHAHIRDLAVVQQLHFDGVEILLAVAARPPDFGFWIFTRPSSLTKRAGASYSNTLLPQAP